MSSKDNIISYTIENLKSKDDLIKEFDLLSLESFLKDIKHLKRPHRHYFYTFIYVISGKGSHVIDFIEYELKSNRIFFINYGQVHQWLSINRAKGFVVLFTEQFYNLIFTGNDSIKSDTALNHLETFLDIDSSEYHEWLSIFKQIEQEFADKKLYNREIICMLLKILTLKYIRLQSQFIQDNKTHRKFDLVNKYKELINRNFIERKIPKEYAIELSITPNYLNAICKQTIGLQAGELIKQRVILEAKRLLTHSDLTVTEISYQLGFDDKSHFGKYFKSSLKKSPEQFRKEFLKNNMLEL